MKSLLAFNPCLSRLAQMLVLSISAAVLVGCAHPALQESQALAAGGQHEQALARLNAARGEKPDDAALRSAQLRQRELTLSWLYSQGEAARSGGQLAQARDIVKRMQAVDAKHGRTVSLQTQLRRDERHSQQLAKAQKALAAKRFDEAQSLLREILSESPNFPAARELQQKLAERTAAPVLPTALSEAFQKPVTLEFRDAPLRSVFEALSRGTGVNFVFDRDVRGDAKVSVFLRDVTLDEAMRVIQTSQQLERKLLNDHSVLIYPNTQAKQREHQELVTKSFYLTNADVKQAQALVRMMAKTRDLFIDERLNLLVARDTPEVLAIIERLLSSIDLPEPEVVMEVEVLEVSRNRLADLGLSWPTQAQYGLPSSSTSNPFGGLGTAQRIEWGQRDLLRGSIANPAFTATANGSSSETSLLANPKLRARNREKAKIQIGEKLPVFTSTATANVGVSSSVSYLDVGIKLEVEPSVQLNDEVVIKVNLEVSNVLEKVVAQGASAYRVGTRNASTSLRLRDGETQILGGLINDNDRKSAAGLPYLSEAPMLGRLFGVQSDNREKSEVVLLITPRIVRNLVLPDANVISVPSGFDTNPGAETSRLRAKAGVAVPLAGGGGVGAPPSAPAAESSRSGVPTTAFVEIQTSGAADVGETVAVTLQNQSSATVKGEWVFDPNMLHPTEAGGESAKTGRVPFELPPRGQRVIVFRVQPAAAGNGTSVELGSLVAVTGSGQNLPVEVKGDGSIEVNAQ